MQPHPRKSRRATAAGGPIARDGWLFTRKKNQRLGWKQRYIKLDGSQFTIFRDLKTMRLKAELDLKGATVHVIAAQGHVSTRKYVFYSSLILHVLCADEIACYQLKFHL